MAIVIKANALNASKQIQGPHAKSGDMYVISFGALISQCAKAINAAGYARRALRALDVSKIPIASAAFAIRGCARFRRVRTA